jgi:hypothetical protein
MMNIPMMEDKLEGSSNFKFLEENNSEGDLLWVIQESDTMTTLFMKMSRGHKPARCIGEIISAPSGMHLYIYYLYHYHERNCRILLVEAMDPEGSQCIQEEQHTGSEDPMFDCLYLSFL